MELSAPIVEGRSAITGYGAAGFRIGTVAHHGGLLVLPDGMYSWSAAKVADIDAASLKPLLEIAANAGFLILGTGMKQIFPSAEIRRQFTEAGIGLEPMDTGAACRTYNILLDEQRIFAAAFLPLI